MHAESLASHLVLFLSTFGRSETVAAVLVGQVTQELASQPLKEMHVQGHQEIRMSLCRPSEGNNRKPLGISDCKVS